MNGRTFGTWIGILATGAGVGGNKAPSSCIVAHQEHAARRFMKQVIVFPAHKVALGNHNSLTPHVFGGRTCQQVADKRTLVWCTALAGKTTVANAWSLATTYNKSVGQSFVHNDRTIYAEGSPRGLLLVVSSSCLRTGGTRGSNAQQLRQQLAHQQGTRSSRPSTKLQRSW